MDGWVRRSLLGGIVAVAVLLRLLYVARHGTDGGWNDMVLVYGSLALNILHGHGYVQTISPQLQHLAADPRHILSMTVVGHAQPGPATRPIAYYLPAYPFLIAVVWKLTGMVSYTGPQAVYAVADGVLGPVALWLMLRWAGYSCAGSVAAALYAVSGPIIATDAVLLPDGLANLFVLCGVAALSWALLRHPTLLAFAAGGLVLGLSSWFRGDTLVFLGIVPLCVLAVRVNWLRRMAVAGAILAGGSIPVLALTSFYAWGYGAVHLTRPGAGLLLWEGIGQYANPWRIVAGPPALGGLDRTAGVLLRAHHLVYGAWTGDHFLLMQALDHMRFDPSWFVVPTLLRLLRVVSVEGALSSGPHELLVAGSLIVLGVLGIWSKSRGLLLLLALVWLARLVPFALLRDDQRFLLALLWVYGLCIGAACEDIATMLWATGTAWVRSLRASVGS